MIDRFKVAAVDGLVLGVKWAIALGVVLFVVSWLVRDYDLTRARAQNGQLAYETFKQHEARFQTLLSWADELTKAKATSPAPPTK